ncbi:MAG TPA: sensor histidine kinase, partial [Solirubrobacteraceae bacterium]
DGAYLTDDIHADPRFRGWWPRAHPDMRSFLGVPIVAPEEGVIGAFYLTEKETAPNFDEHDRQLIELLASHAAIAITNARLYEQSRELSMLSERNRLSLELHDVVSQKLFSLNLAAEAAATLLDRGADEARPQLERVRELAREALAELRSLIFGLRPAELARDGLEGVLRKEATMLQRVHGVKVRVDADGEPPAVEPASAGEILRIVEEALHNAVRHAEADTVTVHLHGSNRHTLMVEVADDGIGFDPTDPELRSRHLGLTSMEERARELGGTLTFDAQAGRGTTVSLEVPVDGR